MCTKFIEGYVCSKKFPPLKTPFNAQYRPSKKRHNPPIQRLLHEEIIALQCSSISIRKGTKCPTHGCGKETVSTQMQRPHKHIGTNPRDNKEKLCLTKLSMAKDEIESFFIPLYPRIENQVSHVGIVSLFFFFPYPLLFLKFKKLWMIIRSLCFLYTWLSYFILGFFP